MRVGIFAVLSAVAALGCAPVEIRGPEPSVVALMRDDGAYCNAFAVSTPRGPRLVTAAHCVPERGAPVRFRIFQHVLTDLAQVETWDPIEDTATLIPPPELVLPLLTPAKPSGRVVFSVSGFANWKTAAGEVLAIGGRYYVTTLNVWPGWSGSPVLDARGRAIGVLVLCNDGPAYGKDCAPHSGIFVGLPTL